MRNNYIEGLQKKHPAHQSLISVSHLINKDERIVVSAHFGRYAGMYLMAGVKPTSK